MWYYTFVTLALWIINPELRRLFDWHSGSWHISTISLLPLLAILPHFVALSFGGGWRRLPRCLAIAAWLWIGAFTYGLMLAIPSDNVLAAGYAFALFVLPIGVGLWIATQGAPSTLAVQRVTGFLFAATTGVCIYGIIQYILVPPWDAFWLKNVGYGPLGGRAEPFAIRVFSTFGSAVPLATFLACMLLCSLPYLSAKRPWLIAQFQIWIIAFCLTLSRTGWLMFALGLAVYIALAANRRTIIAVVALSGIFFITASALLSSTPAAVRFTDDTRERLQTFSDLAGDESIGARRDLVYADGIRAFESAPLGRGLGVVGEAAKLSASRLATDFDSGILARMIELGIPGAAILFSAFLVCFEGLISVWNTARSRDVARRNATASSIAILVATVCGEFSVDVAGFLALIFWLQISPVLISHRGKWSDGSLAH
jgi:hypothetical protein